MQCAVCTVLSTGYSVNFRECSVQCTMCFGLYEVSNVQCTVCSISVFQYSALQYSAAQTELSKYGIYNGVREGDGRNWWREIGGV